MNNEKLNTTDWKTFPERIRIYHESSTNSFDWGDANCAGDSDEVLYQRFDTIPSKAQVAREFAKQLYRSGKLSIAAMSTITDKIEEWEGAGEKTKEACDEENNE